MIKTQRKTRNVPTELSLISDPEWTGVSPRTHGGSRHCSLVRKLKADNPLMCFSEPECGQDCRQVERLQCRTVQDRQCRTVSRDNCFNVQEQVGPDFKYFQY